MDKLVSLPCSSDLKMALFSSGPRRPPSYSSSTVSLPIRTLGSARSYAKRREVNRTKPSPASPKLRATQNLIKGLKSEITTVEEDLERFRAVEGSDEFPFEIVTRLGYGLKTTETELKRELDDEIIRVSVEYDTDDDEEDDEDDDDDDDDDDEEDDDDDDDDDDEEEEDDDDDDEEEDDDDDDEEDDDDDDDDEDDDEEEDDDDDDDEDHEEDEDEEDDDDEDDEEEDEEEDSGIPMKVSIFQRSTGQQLELDVTAFHEEICVDHFSIKKPEHSDRDFTKTGGEYLANLQKELVKYLEVKGVTPNTIELWKANLKNKKGRESLLNMKNFKAFMEQSTVFTGGKK